MEQNWIPLLFGVGNQGAEGRNGLPRLKHLATQEAPHTARNELLMWGRTFWSQVICQSPGGAADTMFSIICSVSNEISLCRCT